MRIRYGFTLAAFFIPFFLNTSCFTHRTLESSKNYTRLVELIQLEDRNQPLYTFNDFDAEFDKASHRASRQYFKDHPGLIARIKNELNGGRLRWKLRNLKHRLVFVPENRTEYATLYESYCHDVIDAILAKTGFDNPYDRIHTLNRSQPAYHKKNEGITAYIVHNLAKEYIGTYIFFDQTDKKVKIELKGKLYSGEVGAYTSTLIINDSGAVEFLKDKYTIWQNSAQNPYTALMVPAEETLHIILRKYTEKAIRKSLKMDAARSSKTVVNLVNEWLAIEEAVVGGIVRILLPQILETYLDDLPLNWIDEDLDEKGHFKKYRLLQKGITLVEDLGYKEIIRLYSKDPIALGDLLL
jgi:hypothetical protein